MVRLGTLRALERDVGELLERHERGSALREFERYRDDPAGFAEDVLGVQPWSAQRTLLRHVVERPQTLVLGGHGVGKDWAGAVLALWWVFSRRGIVLATAATQRQATEVFHAELARLFRGAPALPGDCYRSALRVPGAGGVLSFVSSESSKSQGFHGELVLGIATEAQALPPWAFEALRGCAVGPEDRLLLLANPLAPSGPVYEAAQSDRWQVLRVPATSHPNITEGRQVIPGGPSARWIDEMRATYGASSSVFLARVMAEFPEAGEDSLLARGWLERAAERHQEGWRRAEAVDAEPVVGVDVARLGGDRTTVAVMRGPRVEALHVLPPDELMPTAGRVVRILREEGVTPAVSARDDERIRQEAAEAAVYGWGRGRDFEEYTRPASGTVVVDSVGLGCGLNDRLAELRYRTVAYHGSHAPRTRAAREQYANRRAEDFWALRAALEAGDVALPPEPDLHRELLAVTWTPNSKGQVQLDPKDAIRARLGGTSPDLADAVVLAVGEWAARRRRGDLRPSSWPTVTT